ncbi:MAG TPA: hypothetical protein VM240_02685 [Verrucomicrobiae bacterium]|nr:hypothetical protein [Verrucomicrobiae bacterium]
MIAATSKPTALEIRGADSINLAGWDGTVTTAAGSAWVPVGTSRWEWGCNADIAGKAQSDFSTRSGSTDPSVAAATDFVFVSPRIWAGKDKWRKKADGAKQWKEVRAYDADDLEAWLEAAPGVAIWFGEKIGVRGSGVESPAEYWDNWRRQTKIHLTTAAVTAGREKPAAALRDALVQAPVLIVVEADSTEEATAFVSGQLIELGHADRAAVVTAKDGWRFVDANPHLKVAVAANPEVSHGRAPKDGMTMIVPVNIGDRPDYFSPLGAQAAQAQRVVLERPDYEHFEKALVALGEDEADAARLTRSTGRSWSVYRRRRGHPAMAEPAWMKDPAARCLTTVVLVGGWNAGRAGDRACLEAVTGEAYEKLERDLLHIARLDDAPVLQIGPVWRAKAALELLHLFGPRFTQDELKRFFSAAKAILGKPDPALELKPEQRWAASVYGKARDESGIVIDSIADSLAKLRVYAENNAREDIMSGVDELVGALLAAADSDRWLSLHGVLRELAEASPDAFLNAVEKSLQRSDAPIRRLFAESSGDGVFGRTWHANLLCALEVLAWSPRNLSRVTDILAQLASCAVQPNLANRPSNTLASLFRPWWPQTTASTELRLAALDRLIRVHNNPAWDLLEDLIPTGAGFASANAKPHWRDDDAGAAGPNDREGVAEYLAEYGKRVVAQAHGHAPRIAALVRSLDSFHGEYREQIIRLVEGAQGLPDEGRELIRSALRKYLNWHNSYNRKGGKRSRAAADRLRPLFDALAPKSAVKRHAWLFDNGWVELPDGREKDYKKQANEREHLRREAVQEILREEAWDGLADLGRIAGAQHLVGWEIARAGLDSQDLRGWVLERFAESGSAWHNVLLDGFLHGLERSERLSYLGLAAGNLEAEGLAAFCSAAPCDRATWTFLEGCDVKVQDIYWRTVRPGILRAEGDDLIYAVDKLVKVDRHRTAFAASHIEFRKGDTGQMVALLEGIARGAEPDGPRPDGWRIGQAIEAITKAGTATRRQLALLEFAFFQGLEYGKGAKNLNAEMLADPALFMDCVALVFKRRNAPDETADETRKANVTQGWHVLHNGRGVPGQLADGTIDKDQFETWCSAVRKLAVENDRQDVTDVVIGEWLSTCPAEADGSWPCLVVRELLERGDASKVCTGFRTGVINNRGVHSRAVGEGGQQERDLAAKYRAFAAPLQGTHPRTAAVLESIAQSYDAQGRDHDLDSRLWKEGAR